MPIYKFVCPRCGKEVELLLRMKETSEVLCPQCAGVMERSYAGQRVELRGSGFWHWFKRDDWGKAKR